MTLTFAVDRVFKGDALARQTVTTAASGSSCGLELAGEGVFLMFADADGGAALASGLCSGSGIASGWSPLGSKSA